MRFQIADWQLHVPRGHVDRFWNFRTYFWNFGYCVWGDSEVFWRSGGVCWWAPPVERWLCLPLQLPVAPMPTLYRNLWCCYFIGKIAYTILKRNFSNKNHSEWPNLPSSRLLLELTMFLAARRIPRRSSSAWPGRPWGLFLYMESPFPAKEDDPRAKVSHCSDLYCLHFVQYPFVQCSPVPLSSHYTVWFYSNAAERDLNLTGSFNICNTPARILQVFSKIIVWRTVDTLRNVLEFWYRNRHSPQ